MFQIERIERTVSLSTTPRIDSRFVVQLYADARYLIIVTESKQDTTYNRQRNVEVLNGQSGFRSLAGGRLNTFFRRWPRRYTLEPQLNLLDKLSRRCGVCGAIQSFVNKARPTFE